MAQVISKAQEYATERQVLKKWLETVTNEFDFYVAKAKQLDRDSDEYQICTEHVLASFDKRCEALAYWQEFLQKQRKIG